jgi:hypothetical protein
MSSSRPTPITELALDVDRALRAVFDAFPSRKDPLGRLLRIYVFVTRRLTRLRAPLDRLAGEVLTRGNLSATDIERIVGSDLGVRRPAA